MSHMLDFSKGKAAFASYRQLAWHNYGHIFEEQPQSIHQLAEAAGLDFNVEKLPNVHRLPDGSEVVSDNSFFTYRKDTNTILGDKLGKEYTVLDNEEVLSIVEPLLKDQRLQFETAGVIRNGSRIFLTGKLTDPMVIDSRDVVDNYFVIFNSHDGSLSVMTFYTPIRIVCNNTLQMAFNQTKDKITIRHSTNVRQRTIEATKILTTAKANAEIFVERAQHLKKQSWTERKFFDYIANIFMTPEEMTKAGTGQHPLEFLSSRKRNIITGVLDFSESGVGQQEAIPGSAWWAYNAVTGYYAHKEFTNDEKYLESNLFGAGHSTMTKALNLAVNDTKIRTLQASLN